MYILCSETKAQRMIKYYILAGFLFILSPFFSQSLELSGATVIGDNTGNFHPQIEIGSDGEPMVLWSDPATKSVYFTKKENSVFLPPIQLNPIGLETQVYNWSGPDLAVSENSIYVVFRSEGYETGHIYCVKSEDGGINFSDTVRVDQLNVGYGQYPDIAVYNDTLFTTFMAHDANGMNPQYVLARSFDGGMTFESIPIVAGAITGAEACDCCQPEIVVNEEVVVILFRNNASNIRDIKGVVSYDRGSTFTQIAVVDNHNWSIQSCPSTGPDGRISSSNKLYSVYKSVENSSGKVFLNTYDLNLDNSVSTINLSENIANGANYPQLCFKNDTVGVVFEGIGLNTDVFFIASYAAENGFNISNRINVTNVTGIQSKPDIAYSNGDFHLVYSEGNDLKYVVIGKSASLDKKNFEFIQQTIIFSKSQPTINMLSGTLYSSSGQQVSISDKIHPEILDYGTYYLFNQIQNRIQKLIIIP